MVIVLDVNIGEIMSYNYTASICLGSCSAVVTVTVLTTYWQQQQDKYWSTSHIKC